MTMQEHLPGKAFNEMTLVYAGDARNNMGNSMLEACLLYTSDAADDLLCVDLGGRRLIKKKKNNTQYEINTSSISE